VIHSDDEARRIWSESRTIWPILGEPQPVHFPPAGPGAASPGR
jgi:hypothetical protein